MSSWCCTPQGRAWRRRTTVAFRVFAYSTRLLVVKPPGLFGCRTRGIDELASRRAVVPRSRNAGVHHRSFEPLLAMIELEIAHRGADLLDALQGRRGRRLREHEYEVAIGVAARHVALAQVLSHDAPNLAQHRLAELLIAIRLEHAHRERRLGARGAMQLARQRLFEIPAIDEPGR